MAIDPTPDREGTTRAGSAPQAPWYRASVTREPLPEPIPDTPENVAAALMSSPPRKPDEWRYQQDCDTHSDSWHRLSIREGVYPLRETRGGNRHTQGHQHEQEEFARV